MVTRSWKLELVAEDLSQWYKQYETAKIRPGRGPSFECDVTTHVMFHADVSYSLKHRDISAITVRIKKRKLSIQWE
jgi:hypothetical protein